MNIFYLHKDPKICAHMHCDKHVCKMIIEYAQMLSTAHRVLDEKPISERFYKLAHINHPSTIWTRTVSANYQWLYSLWSFLCGEYTERYGKEHLTEIKLRDKLWQTPKNIPFSKYTTEIPQCMPDDVKTNNPLDAYHNFYRKYKTFAKWKYTETPRFMEI